MVRSEDLQAKPKWVEYGMTAATGHQRCHRFDPVAWRCNLRSLIHNRLSGLAASDVNQPWDWEIQARWNYTACSETLRKHPVELLMRLNLLRTRF